MDQLIRLAREEGCSDIHITPGEPPVFRKIGELERTGIPLTPDESEAIILSIMTEGQKQRLKQGSDVDFSYEVPGSGRQRVNIYKERGQICCAIRILNETIPTMEQLRLPPVLKKLALMPRGLILVTGPTGSGKSTTLASMVDYINQNTKSHILTIEDPIEYRYQSRQALIHQREVGEDTESFASSLRSALREDPDVILVGEMRDHETISAALTAAETGHLVLSTLHTVGAANTIDRIIDVFPAEGQHQVRTQLSTVLQGVITQQLLPTADGQGRVASLEILLGNDAVRNLIRDDKCHQLGSMIQTGTKEGMCTSGQSLAQLVAANLITYETAVAACSSEQELRQYIRPSW